ncbi:MAG: nucleotidyltransferase family protein [Metallosphaera yellowstonensis]|nr:nucleotidyltransferase family protein [Metallosphaera yellowstonensis]
MSNGEYSSSMDVGTVVLAAGEGKRFGRNKLLMTVGGKTIIEWAISALPRPRVVVVGRYAIELFPVLKSEVVIYNPNWANGMSTSLKLGVRFFQDMDGILVALGDMPLVSEGVVKRMLEAYSSSCLAVVPTYEGKLGNPVILSKKLFPEIWKLEGDTGARKIIRNVKEICLVQGDEGVLIDVDTEADLAEVSRRLS